MEKLTILLLKIMLKRVKKYKQRSDNDIVKKAYDNCIESFYNTIHYLEAI